MMFSRKWSAPALATGVLAGPLTALADFSIGEFPQFAQDNAPEWLFQILSGLLLALVQLLTGMLFGTATV